MRIRFLVVFSIVWAATAFAQPGYRMSQEAQTAVLNSVMWLSHQISSFALPCGVESVGHQVCTASTRVESVSTDQLREYAVFGIWGSRGWNVVQDWSLTDSGYDVIMYERENELLFIGIGLLPTSIRIEYTVLDFDYFMNQ